MSITLIIIVITVLVSILAGNKEELKSKMLFNSYQVVHRKEYYRLISHGVIHSGWLHLAVNMWVLYIFGNYVESVFNATYPSYGRLTYFGLYVGALIFSSFSALYRHHDNPGYNSLGASGAVSAVLYAYIILAPTNEIYLYFAIGIPAFIFGILYLIYEYKMDQRSKGRIAHDAHFMGAVFGVLFMVILNVNYLSSFANQVKMYFINLIG